MDKVYAYIAALDPGTILLWTGVAVLVFTSWVGLLGLTLFTHCSSVQLTASLVATASFTYGCGTFVLTTNRLLNLELSNPAKPALFILGAMLLVVAVTRVWNENED